MPITSRATNSSKRRRRLQRRRVPDDLVRLLRFRHDGVASSRRRAVRVILTTVIGRVGQSGAARSSRTMSGCAAHQRHPAVAELLRERERRVRVAADPDRRVRLLVRGRVERELARAHVLAPRTSRARGPGASTAPSAAAPPRARARHARRGRRRTGRRRPRTPASASRRPSEQMTRPFVIWSSVASILARTRGVAEARVEHPPREADPRREGADRGHQRERIQRASATNGSPR